MIDYANNKKPVTPRAKKQNVSIKANASKVLAKKKFLESGAFALATNSFPKTVPVAIAHPDKGARANDAANNLAALTNSKTFQRYIITKSRKSMYCNMNS